MHFYSDSRLFSPSFWSSIGLERRAWVCVFFSFKPILFHFKNLAHGHVFIKMLLYIQQMKINIINIFSGLIFVSTSTQSDAVKASHSVTGQMMKFYDQLKSVICLFSCLHATKVYCLKLKRNNRCSSHLPIIHDNGTATFWSHRRHDFKQQTTSNLILEEAHQPGNSMCVSFFSCTECCSKQSWLFTQG